MDWYVGAMTDWTPRELEIDLASFLAPATSHAFWTMTSFADGPDADTVPTSYRRESTFVTARPRIKVKLAPGGGWAAHISVGHAQAKRDHAGGAPARR
jgi:alpha-glucosidase